MLHPNRREFAGTLLGSLMAYGLIESVFASNLFADSVKPVVGKWLTDLANLSRDLRGKKMKDTEFQANMEELYRKIDLAELVKNIQLDKLAASNKLPDNGAANFGIDFAKIEGAPAKPGFGKQIFGLKKDRSIVPHGHANMCTGFIVLRGDFTGKHYDKLETHADHYIIKPTIDRAFKPGDLSTISDHKDNIHWFKCDSDTGFIFNVHVMGYDPAISEPSGRLYLDPEGEKLAGGLVKAKKMTSSECHKKFG
ncbi:MAG: hypothetical protein ACJ8F7_18115 [Gemmataceae bacterium]